MLQWIYSVECGSCGGSGYVECHDERYNKCSCDHGRLYRDPIGTTVNVLGLCVVLALLISGGLQCRFSSRPAESVQAAAIDTQQPERPKPGYSLPCYVTEVYDGDTVTVVVSQELRIRLLDCWAPEIRTQDAEEKQRGLAARDHLKNLAENEQGILWIPLGDRLDESFTFGRALGRIWLEKQDKPLSELMIEAGHATKEKGE